jgi:hypothetical protein
MRQSVLFKRALITALVVFSANSVFAQTDCDKLRNLKLLNNSYQCKWAYYKLKDTLLGTVIKFHAPPIPCGPDASASLTIIQVGTDTIRVLDFCNDMNFKKGQKIKISPQDEPPYRVSIPFYFDVIDELNNVVVSRTDEYDELVFNTTWGELELL